MRDAPETLPLPESTLSGDVAAAVPSSPQDPPPEDMETTSVTPRLVRPEGSDQDAGAQAAFVRIGDRRPAWDDLYHLVLTTSWPWFLVLVMLLYAVVNMAFALLYFWGEGNIEGARPGSFADALYFSVQTLLTIGYGAMHPETHYANLLASLESMLGITSFAMLAAVMFARVSRPTARVLFSRVAVVGLHEGRPALMFRAANRRYNHILEATVLVTLVRTEVTAEGEPMRRFHELPLLHARTPIFNQPWKMIHPIDEASPLCGETPATLAAAQAEIVVLLSGIDDAYAQTVHVRHSYITSEIHWNARFADVMTLKRRGRMKVDFRRFHHTESLDDGTGGPSSPTAQEPAPRLPGRQHAGRGRTP